MNRVCVKGRKFLSALQAQKKKNSAINSCPDFFNIWMKFFYYQVFLYDVESIAKTYTQILSVYIIFLL